MGAARVWVCENGHTLTTGFANLRLSDHDGERCRKCGAPLLARCPNCGKDIKPFLSSAKPPSHCHGCGELYPWATTTPTNSVVPTASRIFLSHAEPDSELAKYLQATLEETQGITVFVASRPGHIPLGKKWFDHVMDELQGASAYVVLLTPSSKARPWVAFETGAAFLTGRPCAPVCVGVKPGEIGGPYVGLQLIPLDSAETVRVVFEQLGARPPRNAAAFLRRVDDLVREGLDAVAAAEGWQYVTIDGRDYAWEGPLEALEDREPEFVNYEVFDPLIRPQLEAARLEVRWRRIEGYAREGAKRVFLTDRRTYRRPIVDHDVCLTVKTSPDDRTA